MKVEQTFLIKKGIHNFVSCVMDKGQYLFLIRASERESMVDHAKRLIEDCYGDKAAIRLV